MDIIEKIYHLKKAKKRFIVTTLVESSGATPGKTGLKMIIHDDGKTWGTIGDVNLEMLVVKDGLEMLRQAENGLKTYNLNKKSPKQEHKIGTEMQYNGSAMVYFECINPRYEVYIFGGGHIAQELSRILNKQKYRVFVIDDRKEFINEKLYPQVDERILTDYRKYSKYFEPARNSYFIILTRYCKYNYEILKNIYQRKVNAKYVGMLGSKVEVTASLKKLKSEIGKVDLENLYTPVGPGIGGDIPSETALMIAAEMQMVEYGKRKN